MATIDENRLWLTPDEVARLLRLHVQTVRKMMRDGRIPAHKIGPRVWRVSAQELNRWALQQGVGALNLHVAVDAVHGGYPRDLEQAVQR